MHATDAKRLDPIRELSEASQDTCTAATGISKLASTRNNKPISREHSKGQGEDSHRAIGVEIG